MKERSPSPVVAMETATDSGSDSDDKQVTDWSKDSASRPTDEKRAAAGPAIFVQNNAASSMKPDAKLLGVPNKRAALGCNELGQEAVEPQHMPSRVGDWDLDLDKLLGRGAFSLVFRGTHKSTQAKAAVKAITLAPENAAGFHSELKANRVVLGHPNVVALLGSQPPVDGPTGFLMFEYCERGEVFDLITPNAGLQPREYIGSFFAQLVEAVAHVHGCGVCHLDIKPENLFVDGAGRVKLGDLGLSTFSEDGPVLDCRGSMAYAAPENVKSALRKTHDANGCRARAQGYDGQRADMWSVGVVLFVMLYGLTPWDVARDTSYEFRMYKLSSGYPNLPPWDRLPAVFRTLLHHTIWIRPSRRWSAAELRGYLARDVGWAPAPPKPPGRTMSRAEAMAAAAAAARARQAGAQPTSSGPASIL